MSSTLEQLIEEITFRRRREMRLNSSGGKEISAHQNTTYWTDLFVRHFLFQTDYEADRDDLLFFIRKTGNPPVAGSLSKHNKQHTTVEVFRRDSRKLPIGDPDVDWEETIYLNLIVHQLEYTITLAICSRTSPKDLQVLKRHTQKVYATPSRRKMDGKGDGEEITYPHICFSVDNFEDGFEDVIVRDGESVGIELTASAPRASINTVLFTACVPYETVRRVHEARASQTVQKRLSQASLFTLFSGKQTGPRVEYVRLLGGADGHAELAVCKTTAGCDTPCSEPCTDLLDLWGDDLDTPDTEVYFDASGQSPYNHSRQEKDHQQQGYPINNNVIGAKKGHQRRLSDPSSAIHDFMRMGILDKPSNRAIIDRPGGASSLFGSKSDGLDSFGDAHCEIYAGDLLDEFEEAKYNPLWTMKGYTQIFHSWRESKRCQSVPLSSACTYVMLPWWAIINTVLEHPQQPLLTF